MPETVSKRHSKEAEIWNSLKRQAITPPVVAPESPSWLFRVMGVFIDEPTMAW